MVEIDHETRSVERSANYLGSEFATEQGMQSIFYSAKILWHRDRLLPYVEQYNNLKEDGRLTDQFGIIPVTMEIDLSNLCSHRCPLCIGQRMPESQNEQLFPVAGDGEYMPTARAADYITQMAAAGVKGLIFTGGGDPTNHSDLVPLMGLAHDFGMSVGLITHGGLLHKHDIAGILSACTWIRVSVDAGNESDFEKVHGRGKTEWEQVWRNISQVVARKKLYENWGHKPTIGIAFLAGPHNIDGLGKLVELARAHGVDYLQVRPFHSFLKFDAKKYLSDLTRCFDTPDFKVIASLQKYFRILNGQIEPRNYSYCHLSQFASVICANEKMYVCCHKRNIEKYCIGDLRKESLIDILCGKLRATKNASVDVYECQPLCRGDHVNRQIQSLIDGCPSRAERNSPPLHIDFL